MAKSTTVATVFFIVFFIIDIVSFVIPFWTYWEGETILLTKKKIFQGLWFGCVVWPSETKCTELDTSATFPGWLIAALVLETVGLFVAVIAFITVCARKLCCLKLLGPLAGLLVGIGAIIYFAMYDGDYQIHAGVVLAMVAGAGMAFSGLYLIAVPDEEEEIPLEKRI